MSTPTPPPVTQAVGQAALTNLREAQSPADTLAAVDNASQATIRLRRILKDLRKLPKLDARMLEHRPVDVAELVDEMVGTASSLLAYQGRSLNLLVSKAPALPLVICDRDMLWLVVYNLFDNALKYSTATNAVEVRVCEDVRALFVEVTDGGVGIPLQEQGQIFDDLYQRENARETEGSGFGLVLARRITQLYGGKIFLHSDPPQEHGTVFTIRLPV